MRFTDRVVVVTGGGGTGLGGGLARAFASEGASVVVADADEDAARRVADGLAASGRQALAVGVDVRSETATQAMAQAAVDAFGRIDVLVNNAFTACQDPFLDAPIEGWERDIDVILKGAFLSSRAVLPAMLERGSGAIVSVSSVNAHTHVGSYAYSAAKAGVESLTRNLAVEFGPGGVRANAVVPGTFETDVWDERRAAHPGLLERIGSFHAIGRVGTIAEIAAATLFLASDEASFVNGALLRVDGGLLSGDQRFANAVHP